MKKYSFMKYNIMDYTTEWCPECEQEVEIYSQGVTICPSCHEPILPCSVCKDCVTNCPYNKINEKEFRTISKEEQEWSKQWNVTNVVWLTFYNDKEPELKDNGIDNMSSFCIPKEKLEYYVKNYTEFESVEEFMKNYTCDDMDEFYLTAKANDDIIGIDSEW